MSSGMAGSIKFSFQSQELSSELRKHHRASLTGYWQISTSPVEGEVQYWYLVLVQGKVVFSAKQLLSWPTLLAVLKRYIPRLRIDWSETALRVMEERIPADQLRVLGETLVRMERLALLRPGEAVNALRLHLLAELNQHLYERAGQAEFIPNHELALMAPMEGFDLDPLLLEAANRRDQWNTLKTQVPTLAAIPIANPAALDRYQLKEEQKKFLQAMTEGQKTLEGLSFETGKDPLEVAKLFANWVRLGIVTLKLPAMAPSVRTIVAVDDSVVMQELVRRTLPQFRVVTTGNAAEALSLIFRYKPDLIVLDVTMPEIDGLEICKTIRNVAHFKSTPIIMLTARDGLVDRLRGKLAGATTYLTKPFNPEEFKRVIQQSLQSLTSSSSGAGDATGYTLKDA